MSATVSTDPFLPKLGKITRTDGIAGQVAYDVSVTYLDSTSETVTFVGSTYGTPGPIVMITGTLGQVHVDDPGRCGDKLDPSWIRRFFGQEVAA